MRHAGLPTSARRFTMVSRALVVAYALAQMFLPGTLSVLDGIVARDSQPAVVHVEAPGSHNCPRVHDIDDCAICQFLAHATAAQTKPARFCAPTHAVVAPTAARRIVQWAVWRPRFALPRAPPVA